ncbi:MAG: phytase precursor [Bacteroidetes bacterium]|nr:phytase precursor [Bacteroidota bacterium]
MKKRTLGLLLLATVLFVACGGREQGDDSRTEESPRFPVVEEVYMTERNEEDNVDSPAIWHGEAGDHWIIVTCKSTDRLLVHDAVTGELVRAVGVSGSGPGQFSRPNGIAVVDDLAIVVERDNHRLQVFRLPEWTVLGSFGETDLVKPYGIALRRDAATYILYVTDNYEMPDGSIPPPGQLGERVKVFQLSVEENTVTGSLLHAFGATTGNGVLQLVESICVDTLHNRLLIADEYNKNNDIKIYDLDGAFTGEILGSDVFRYEPEGVVLFTCPDGSGYYICTDQDMADNTFHIFDRVTLAHIGAFQAAVTANTDGIAITQRSFAGFDEGIFVAVHNDGNVGTFDWRTIADALALKHRCIDETDSIADDLTP